MDLSAILAASKDVEFQDVYYTVKERRNFVKEAKSRCILKGVSGIFRNGQLSAIMGPSGAGKSSLLNAISGYITSGVSGYLRIDREDSCYMTQEDQQQSVFTVEELMHIACSLKVKSKTTHNEIITDILKNLNLDHRRNVYANKLSGGERKRLSIGLELVANPKIFFLDEPTSGLDEVTAGQCIRLLKSLAAQGRTIVCTIHQPSATIFKLFDQCYVLAKGECIFQGETQGIVPFLSYVNLPCPKYYSPPDYIIEICDFDDGNLIKNLSHITQNGKLTYSTKKKLWDDDDNNDVSKDHVYHFRNALTSLILDSPQSSNSFSCVGGVALLEKMKAFSRRIKSGTNNNQISSFRQFLVLFNVMMLKIVRNKIALWIQFIHHLMCGLMFGIIYYNSANEGARMFDHLKYCMGCIIVIVYTQVIVPILSYPGDVKVIKKEFFNRWYRLTPYYMALTISRLPFQILFNMIFITIVYWMAGLPNELWRFLLFTSVGMITSFVAEGMGLAIGATFSITNGSVLGPLIIAPFMGLAIYGFDFAKEIPLVMYAVMKISYIRIGAVTMIFTVFGYNRAELDCNEIYCHFSDPRVLLNFLQIENISVLHEFGFLFGLMLFFRILLFVSLKNRCKT